jgi:hypothetical protein
MKRIGEFFHETIIVALSLAVAMQSLAGIDGFIKLSAWPKFAVREWQEATFGFWQDVIGRFGFQISDLIRDSYTTILLIIALAALLPQRRLRLFSSSPEDMIGYACGYVIVAMMLWDHIAEMGLGQKVAFFALVPEVVVFMLVVALIGTMGGGYFFANVTLKIVCVLSLALLGLRLLVHDDLHLLNISVDLLILPFFLLTIIFGTSVRDNFTSVMKVALFCSLLVCWLSLKSANPWLG